VQWVLGARSETGYVRTANEDRMGFTRTPFGNVYVVCDGMGGYRGGALAAELAVTLLQQRLAGLPANSVLSAADVREAFSAANRAVFERRRADDPDTRSMGATGVVLIASGAKVLIGHVGDSRAYLVDRRGRVRQLTRDHTRVQRMVDAGILSTTQAGTHPEASMLDRAIGHAPTVEADVTDWIPVGERDMVLLCSDGLTGYVPDAEIEAVLRSRGSPQMLADKLVALALDKGGEDNVTVQLVRYGRPVNARSWTLASHPAVVMSATLLASAAAVAPLWQRWKDADLRAGKLQVQLDDSKREVDKLRASEAFLQARVGELTGHIGNLSALATAAPPAPATSSAAAKAKPQEKKSAQKTEPSRPTSGTPGKAAEKTDGGAASGVTAGAPAPASQAAPAPEAVAAPSPAVPPPVPTD
jgi:serine/threonine protein phosphatase PrpC